MKTKEYYLSSYSPVPVSKSRAIKAIDWVASELRVPEKAIKAVRERLSKATALEIERDVIQNSGDLPTVEALSLDDLLYYAALAKSLALPGSGDRCREMAHGVRTVLCFSGERIEATEGVVYYVFEEGQPLYMVYFSTGCNSRPPSAQRERIREEVAAIHRSIITFALGLESWDELVD